jgi:hypothetical protein
MGSYAEPNTPVGMQVSEKSPAKAAHVNMMTDTIIANMPAEGLRTVMRGLLGVDPKVTTKLNTLAVEYLAATRPTTIPLLFENEEVAPALFDWQRRYRCMMGCGMGFESMSLLSEVIRQLQSHELLAKKDISESLMDMLAIVDADVVQSVTAVQKELLTNIGTRKMSSGEVDIAESLLTRLVECQRQAEQSGKEFPLERGLSRIQKLEGMPRLAMSSQDSQVSIKFAGIPEACLNSIERFQLGKSLVPRMFMGLWQFSSPAWGTASKSKINKHFRKHVDAGFTAYGAL